MTQTGPGTSLLDRFAALTDPRHQVLFRAVLTDAEAERFGGADGADCRGLRLRDTGSGGARCPGGQGGSLAARADSRMRLSL